MSAFKSPFPPPAGNGTVTSVAMTGDNVIFNSSVSGSPITTSGTLAPSLKTQTANTVFSGPTSGGAVAPTFRALGLADLPSEANNTIVSNITGGASVPSANTVTAVLDSAIGNTQGALAYRNASSWVPLAPGTSGQVLTTGGAAANPSWATNAGGNVSGPGSSTDKAVALWNGTAGTTLQNSLITANTASGQINTPGAILFGNAGGGNVQGQISCTTTSVVLTTSSISNSDIALLPALGSNVVVTQSNLEIQDGYGVVIQTSGLNPTAGRATLVAGTVTVATSACATSSLVILTATGTGILTGVMKVVANANNFVITSTVLTDTAVVNWFLINVN